jgi:hypothetical protein
MMISELHNFYCCFTVDSSTEHEQCLIILLIIILNDT